MEINKGTMAEDNSLSKKWRMAVRAGLFEGSFKEFAEMYNQKIGEKGGSATSFSDNGAAPTGTTPANLAPVDTSKLGQGKILGMTPKVLLIVSGIAVLAIGTGIFLFIRSAKKNDAA